jgi:GMP synthase PP-ATPase subunit
VGTLAVLNLEAPHLEPHHQRGHIPWLAQGALYPDVIESVSPSVGVGAGM